MVVKGYQRHLVKVQLAKGHLIKLFRLCVYISVWMYNLPICGSEKLFFFFWLVFLFVWYFLKVIKDVFCKSLIPGKNSKKLLKKTKQIAMTLQFSTIQSYPADMKMLWTALLTWFISWCSTCQQQLPATGVPITRQRFDHMREKFREYVRTQTLQNWKFWIVSLCM